MDNAPLIFQHGIMNTSKDNLYIMSGHEKLNGTIIPSMHILPLQIMVPAGMKVWTQELTRTIEGELRNYLIIDLVDIEV